MSATTVFVRNDGKADFTDRFDGVDYRFLPGVLIEIPEEAAHHIFGYGEEDKRPYFVRLGWSRLAAPSGENTLDQAMKKLEDFKFFQSRTVVDETPEPLFDDAEPLTGGELGEEPAFDQSPPSDTVPSSPLRKSRRQPVNLLQKAADLASSDG